MTEESESGTEGGETATETGENEGTTSGETVDEGGDASAEPEGGETEVPTPPEEEEKPPLFILESDPFSFAKDCNLANSCLCNINTSDWATW